MRAPLSRLSCLLSLLIASSASAVTIDWVTVGDPGNSCIQQGEGENYCFGGVPYEYRVARYEVTNSQYAEFLNGAADTDPNGLYSISMGSDIDSGITRSGISGSYLYSVKPGMADKPVNYVDWFDTLRFANWLNNGQPVGPPSLSRDWTESLLLGSGENPPEVPMRLTKGILLWLNFVTAAMLRRIDGDVGHAWQPPSRDDAEQRSA